MLGRHSWINLLFDFRFIEAFMAQINVALVISVLVSSLFGAVAANAGELTGRVSEILVAERGTTPIVYVFLEGGTVGKYIPSQPGRPACAGANGDYISFRLDRPAGKQYLNAVMLAYSLGKSVLFRTASACVDDAQSDTIQYLMLTSN
jgi:hypothetical protein